MAELGVCSTCKGFVPAAKERCPNCGHRRGRALLGLAGGALGGGALAFTLMACYGMPPCPDGSRDCRGPGPTPTADDAGAPNAPTPAIPPPAKP